MGGGGNICKSDCYVRVHVLEGTQEESIMLAHGRLSRHVPSGRLVPGPAQRLGPKASSAPPLVRRDFSKKNKKRSDISFLHCPTHATTAGASIALPICHWPSPTRRPSRMDTVCPLRLAVVVHPSLTARSHPSCSPIPHHSLPPVARAVLLVEPGSMLLAMVVVVLAWRRLRP
jgi:hypothetical protein